MEFNKKCDRSFYQLIQLVVKSAIAFTSLYINDRICQARYAYGRLRQRTAFHISFTKPGQALLLKRAVL
ncbi:hypothetical protein [Argonema galeatum]|uniref:hypothetical protein n=1 Tax=Argonema galeatum TaxID=2942762 RepID=UPI0020118986|nr:hypothetical protein [Argonema galeatum]MCL1468352.1 hypothetical protein [Argonema galeatum A003/A1]